MTASGRSSAVLSSARAVSGWLKSGICVIPVRFAGAAFESRRLFLFSGSGFDLVRIAGRLEEAFGDSWERAGSAWERSDRPDRVLSRVTSASSCWNPRSPAAVRSERGAIFGSTSVAMEGASTAVVTPQEFAGVRPKQQF